MFQHTFLYFKSIENVLILFLDPKRPQMRPFDQERHLVENVDFLPKYGLFYKNVDFLPSFQFFYIRSFLYALEADF